MPNHAADKIPFATAHWPENFRPSQTSLARANSAGGVRPSFFLNDSRQSTNLFPTKEDGFTEAIRLFEGSEQKTRCPPPAQRHGRPDAEGNEPLHRQPMVVSRRTVPTQCAGSHCRIYYHRRPCALPALSEKSIVVLPIKKPCRSKINLDFNVDDP